MNFTSLPFFRFTFCFLVVFLGLYAFLAGLRLLACTSSVDLFKHFTFLISACACISLTLVIWRFDKKVIFSYVIFALLYTTVILIKMLNKSTLLDREIVQTVCFALLVCALCFILFYIAQILYSPLFARCFRAIALLGASIGLLFPLVVLGFFITSGGHMLSHDIILALFQTNFSEVRAFLADQNAYLFGLALGGIVFACFKIMQLLEKALTALPPPYLRRPDFGVQSFILAYALWLHFSFCFSQA